MMTRSSILVSDRIACHVASHDRRGCSPPRSPPRSSWKSLNDAAFQPHEAATRNKPSPPQSREKRMVPQGGIEPPTRGFSDLSPSVYPEAEGAGIRLARWFRGSPMSTGLLQYPSFQTLLVTPVSSTGFLKHYPSPLICLMLSLEKSGSPLDQDSASFLRH